MLLNCVLEKTLESPLDCKEIKPVHSKGNQFWIFIGRTDAEAEAPILWPPDVKNWLTGKDPDAGKDWRQDKKGTTEDEMVECHHQLEGHWAWASCRSWWWTRKPGVLQSMGSQRTTELNCFLHNLHSVGPNTTASYRAHSDPVLFCWLISNRFIFILISSLFCHELLPVCFNGPSVFPSVSKLIHLYLVYT